MKTKYLPLVLAFLALSLGGGVLVAQAQINPSQGYTPLAPLPGTMITSGEGQGTTNISTYVAGMIQLLVALGAALAVVYAVIGGTQYVAAGISPDAKNGAKERIVNALVGLTIILTSYLILNSINPDLVRFKLELPPVVVRNFDQGPIPGEATDPSGCPSITDPNVLLDTPESQAMENSGGNAVIFSSSDPVVQQNLDKLKAESNALIGKLAQVNITARVTSAYRPYAYQMHLYEIYKAWKVDDLENNNNPVCEANKATIGAEYAKHGLGSLVSNPATQSSPHVVGTGVDIKIDNIPYDDFTSLGNTHWTNVNTFMSYEGVKLSWQNIPGDRVHFNLRY